LIHGPSLCAWPSVNAGADGRRTRHGHSSLQRQPGRRRSVTAGQGATATSACKPPRIGPPASRSTTRATAAKEGRRRSRTAERADMRTFGEERDCRPGRIETSLCASAGVRGWGNSRGPACPREAARLWRHSCRSRACNIRAPASTGRVGFGHEAFAGVVLAIRAPPNTSWCAFPGQSAHVDALVVRRGA
jgi:hypothetical protein